MCDYALYFFLLHLNNIQNITVEWARKPPGIPNTGLEIDEIWQNRRFLPCCFHKIA